MSEDGVLQRGVAWSEALPFVRLFSTFQRAIDFRRMVLAFVALALVCLVGVALDGLWSAAGGGAAMMAVDERVQSELEPYAGSAYADFLEWRRVAADVRESAAVAALLASGAHKDPAQARAALRTAPLTSLVLTAEHRQRVAEAKSLVEVRLGAGRAALRVDTELSSTERRERERRLVDAADRIRMRLAPSGYRWLDTDADAVREPDLAVETLMAADPSRSAPERSADVELVRHALRTQTAMHQWQRTAALGPFRALVDFESKCFAGALRGLANGRLGFERGPGEFEPAMAGSIVAAVGGLGWLVFERPLFAVLFGAASLLILAYFGGAICRSAAVQSARGESMSIGASLQFAREKYLGFVMAPLTPVGLLLGVAAFVFAGGLISAIPRLGEVFAGVVFPLTLIAGLGMALIATGVLLGFHLMWPTIAVEGSDGFDALSRAWSYVGSRLWSVAFYVVLLLGYGGVGFIVLRWIAQLLLKLTHAVAGIGMNWSTNVALDGVGKLDGIWRMPAWSDLTILPTVHSAPFWGAFHNAPLGASEWIALAFIGSSVVATVGIVAAFVLSFFLCGSVEIYFLLRREVDATDYTDIYYVDSGSSDSSPLAPAPAELPISPPAGE